MIGWFLALSLLGVGAARLYYEQEREEAMEDAQQAVLNIAWIFVEDAKESCANQTEYPNEMCLMLWRKREAQQAACSIFRQVWIRSYELPEEFQTRISETIERANNILSIIGLNRCP